MLNDLLLEQPYSLECFQTDFPTEDSCLEHIFKTKFPDAKGYYRLKERMAYSDRLGHQIYPLKGTIFERSSTPLKSWFLVMHRLTQSDEYVTVKDIQNLIDVNHKTARRIKRKIIDILPEDSPHRIIKAGKVIEGINIGYTTKQEELWQMRLNILIKEYYLLKKRRDQQLTQCKLYNRIIETKKKRLNILKKDYTVLQDNFYQICKKINKT